jgi:hypothetical protein
MSSQAENPISAKQPSEDGYSKVADHAQETQSPAPPIAAPPTPQPCRKHRERTCNTKRDCIDKTTLGFEGIGLFVLIVYTVFTGLMYCANKKAADAATDAAKAARDSVIQAAASSNLDQRAWVGVYDISKPDLGIDKPFTTTVVIRNTGKTPAKDVTASFTITPGDPDAPDFTKLPESTTHGVVQPNGDNQIVLDATRKVNDKLPKNLFDRINTGKTIMLVYGRVTYVDVFGYHHWAESCSFFSLKQKAFAQCKAHDEIDEESR